MGEKITRICLTPTKNESWILETFLAATKLWATHTVVADQCSTDGTLEILRKTPGTDVVINDSPVFDELHRQRLLLDRARQYPGKRILIALDADEALSANCLTSKDWDQIHAAAPGTILRFKWVNVLPGFEKAWIPPNRLVCGFVDDGSPHQGIKIHNPRLPNPENAPILDLDDVVVLHFQYTVWQRMASKQRWYQAWEWLENPAKGPLQIYRQYNHMSGSWPAGELYSIRPEWFQGYQDAGIDYRALRSEPITWWDSEILNMFQKRGLNHFAKIALWDQDWAELASRFGLNGKEFVDPRSYFQTLVHRALRSTQSRRANFAVRGLEYCLRKLGW